MDLNQYKIVVPLFGAAKAQQFYTNFLILCLHYLSPVILLLAHPASFVHNFVSGMQSFYYSETQDAIVLQTCH